MFLVSDNYSDYKNISNYKDLKKLLISELKRDTFENCEQNIVENNFKVMEKLALEDYSDIEYIKEQLSSFGWYVQDFRDMQRDINNLREYLAYKSKDTKAIDEVLDLLDKGVR